MAITPLPKSETDIRTLILNRLEDSSTITAVEHREVENALVDAIFYTPIGDIKEVACTDAYINDNFDMNPTLPLLPGRGKVGSERYGWAICNGYNGTINKMGRVGIGYDPNNYPMNSIPGGVSTVTLDVTQIPPHTHLMKQGNVAGNQPGVYSYTSGDDATGTVIAGSIPPTNITGGAGSTTGGNTTGGSTVAHNNMQPYIVTLFIQKISTPY